MDKAIQWNFYEDLSDQHLLDAWDTINLKTNTLAFYQNKGWFQAYLDSDYDKFGVYGFMLLTVDSTPVGVFPLEYVPINRFELTLNAWRIFWPHDMGIDDFIIDASQPVNCIINKLTQSLSQICKKEWDVLILQDCPVNGVVDTAIRQCRPRLSVSFNHHDSKYIDCRSPDNNALGKLSTKFKKNLRRLSNKLKKSGNVTTHFYREKHELDQAFSDFLKVESAGWKGERQSSLIYDAPQRSFYQSLLKYFGDQRCCVIHTLKLDDKPIASQFAIISGDTYYMLKIGYDETYKEYGPGTVLLEQTIRHFSEINHINKISFVTGTTWQDQWQPESISIFHHFIYNNSIKGYEAYLIEASEDLIRTVKHRIN